MQERQELELLRALAEEKARWETREHRLIALLEQLQGQLSVLSSSQHLPPTAGINKTVYFAPKPKTYPGGSTPINTLQEVPAASETEGEQGGEGGGGGASGENGVEVNAGSLGGGGGEGVRGTGEITSLSGQDVIELQPSSGGGTPTRITTLPRARMPLVAQQLPPLSKFTGETEGAEMIVEWLEQLELVASACGWDEPTRLVNLVTRLKGQAFAFYRSCDTQKRNQYATLVEELKKRFMPVRIQAVQSSLFHDRKQKPGESV